MIVVSVFDEFVLMSLHFFYGTVCLYFDGVPHLLNPTMVLYMIVMVRYYRSNST